MASQRPALAGCKTVPLYCTQPFLFLCTGLKNWSETRSPGV